MEACNWVYTSGNLFEKRQLVRLRPGRAAGDVLMYMWVGGIRIHPLNVMASQHENRGDLGEDSFSQLYHSTWMN